MRRAAALTLGTIVVAAGAWQAVPAIQNAVAPTKQAEAEPAPAPKAAPQPAPPPMSQGTTPMGQRVATLGLLNKRSGLWRDLTLKPGQGVRIGDVVVKLRACETTAPWESEQYTGAFVQVFTRDSGKWYRTFSGWLYKESPSLNLVEHAVYDVWPKACQMRHPDIGPDTIVARGGDDGGSGSGRRSSAQKSAETDDSAAGDAEPSAESSAAE
jgi:hypothetical protein